MAALRFRVDGCRESRFLSVAHAEADGFGQHAEMDQSGVNQFVLFDFPGTRQCDDLRSEPTSIFSSIGLISLDLQESFPDQIESTRQSRFAVVAIGKSVVGYHPR